MTVERTEYDRLGRKWGTFYCASTNPNLTLDELKDTLTSPNKLIDQISVLSDLRFAPMEGKVFVYKYQAWAQLLLGNEHAKRVNSVHDLARIGSYDFREIRYTFPDQPKTHKSGVMEFSFDLTELVKLRDNSGRVIEVQRCKLLAWINCFKESVFLYADHLPPQTLDITAVFVKARIINPAVDLYSLEVMKGPYGDDDPSRLYEPDSTKIVVLDFHSEANLVYTELAQGKFNPELVVSLIQEKMAPYINNRYISCEPCERYIVLLLENADSVS